MIVNLFQSCRCLVIKFDSALQHTFHDPQSKFSQIPRGGITTHPDQHRKQLADHRQVLTNLSFPENFPQTLLVTDSDFGQVIFAASLVVRLNYLTRSRLCQGAEIRTTTFFLAFT